MSPCYILEDLTKSCAKHVSTCQECCPLEPPSTFNSGAQDGGFRAFTFTQNGTNAHFACQNDKSGLGAGSDELKTNALFPTPTDLQRRERSEIQSLVESFLEKFLLSMQELEFWSKL